MTEELIFRLKDLNNKSRKGLYAYVKRPGKKAGYYRFYAPEQAEEIKQRYIDLIDKGIKQPKHTKNKYIARKQPNLEKSIKKGMTKAKLMDAIAAETLDINMAYEKALRPLMKDKELRRLISQETNMQKLKHRVALDIEFFAKDSKIGTAKSIGVETLGEVVDKIQQNFKRNTDISSMEFKQICTLLNWNSSWQYTESKAKLDNITVLFIFRKAR